MRRALSIIIGLSWAGCTDETQFTDEERALLRGYALLDVPADPSNAKADDGAAAILGKKFYFDTRFSGPLGPINDGVTNGSLGVSGASGLVGCVSCHAIDQGGSDHDHLTSRRRRGDAWNR